MNSQENLSYIQIQQQAHEEANRHQSTIAENFQSTVDGIELLSYLVPMVTEESNQNNVVANISDAHPASQSSVSKGNLDTNTDTLNLLNDADNSDLVDGDTVSSIGEALSSAAEVAGDALSVAGDVASAAGSVIGAVADVLSGL